jgi:phenylacetate-CoA ligase
MPTFWARDLNQEKTGGELHDIIFQNIYGLDKNKSTLAIICFAMGVWVAGGFTLASARWLADNEKFQLTSITPGIDKADILAILKNLAPRFEQIVICGYPPFLTDVIKEAKKNKINFNKKLFILASGEKVSEEWRSLTFSLLNKKPDNKSVINVYGSADAGAMAFETPLTICLRKLSLINPQLYKKLFENQTVTPGLYQFNPKHIYFESVNNELLLTADTASPLIRYNIHDQGRVIEHNELAAILENHGIKNNKLSKLLKQWNLPLIVVKSRTDVAITFYSLNIYPEHFKVVLESKKLTTKFTGKFFVFTKTKMTGSASESLHINIELRAGLKPSKKTAELCQKLILESLIKNNLEFRKLFASMGKSARPTVTILPFNSPNLMPKNNKVLGYQTGKKAKIILNSYAK